jgi:hypothetical protein
MLSFHPTAAKQCIFICLVFDVPSFPYCSPRFCACLAFASTQKPIHSFGSDWPLVRQQKSKPKLHDFVELTYATASAGGNQRPLNIPSKSTYLRITITKSLAEKRRIKG